MFWVTILLIVAPLLYGSNCMDESDPAVNYFSINGYTYLQAGDQKMNWYTAMAYCRKMGMQLIDIPTVDEEQRIYKIIHHKRIQAHESYWTSAVDLGLDTKFYWMTTGESIYYANFNAGEPNNKDYISKWKREHCVELRWQYDYKWNDASCAKELLVLCRREQLSPSINEVITEN